MTNKCVVVGCKTGHKRKKRKGETAEDDNDETTPKEKKSMFHFPSDKESRQKWINFVCRKDWTPSINSVVCSDHFDPKYLICRSQRTHLNQGLDPVPDVYPDGYIPYSSMLPSSSRSVPRKPPTDRTIPDEFPDYHRENDILAFEVVNESFAPPPDFSYKRFEDRVVYFLVEFQKSGIREITHTIVIDVDLHVKLYVFTHFSPRVV